MIKTLFIYLIEAFGQWGLRHFETLEEATGNYSAAK